MQENEYEEDNGWLALSAPKYSSDGQSHVSILPQAEGDDNFKHLVHITSDGNKTRLTHGEREVTSIYGWDEENEIM